jgi:hypothetical protein
MKNKRRKKGWSRKRRGGGEEGKRRCSWLKEEKGKKRIGGME